MASIVKSAWISEDIIYIKPPQESERSSAVSEEQLAIAKDTGYAEGYSDGLAKANEQVAEKSHALQTLLSSLPEAIADNRLELSTEIADVVLLITKQLFINQQLNQEAISQQIAHILSSLNEQQTIELFLHPNDLALLQQGQISIDLKNTQNLRIKADNGLTLGGCIIKSEHGVFDGSIERQIDNLKHVLLQMKHEGKYS